MQMIITFIVGLLGYAYCVALFLSRLYRRDHVPVYNGIEIRRTPSERQYRRSFLLLNVAYAGLGIAMMGDVFVGGTIMLFQLFFMLSTLALPQGWRLLAILAVWANLYLATVLLLKMRRDVAEQGHAFRYVIRRGDTS